MISALPFPEILLSKNLQNLQIQCLKMSNGFVSVTCLILCKPVHNPAGGVMTVRNVLADIFDTN